MSCLSYKAKSPEQTTDMHFQEIHPKDFLTGWF